MNACAYIYPLVYDGSLTAEWNISEMRGDETRLGSQGQLAMRKRFKRSLLFLAAEYPVSLACRIDRNPCHRGGSAVQP